MKPKSHSLPNGLLLGYDSGTPLWDTNREGHLMTVAPTGAGKGVSCIIPALLSWQGPAIVIDPRGENYAVTAAQRRELGQQVFVLDPFGITGAPCDALNPLDLLDMRADDFEDNAAVIAQLLMQHAMVKNQDPFWDERARALVVEMIIGMYEENPRRVHTLRHLQDLLNMPMEERSSLTDIFPTPNDANMRKPKPKAINRVSVNKFSEGRTRSSIYATASSHLGFLRSKAVFASLGPSTIMLDDITAGARATIYIVIPPDKLISHSKLLRLWIGVMLTAIARRRRAPPQPTLFLIDEAAQLGSMDELLSALTLLRAYGCRVWTFWQSLSQLQNLYPIAWESIIENSSIQQYFGAASPQASARLKSYLADAVTAAPLKTGEQYLFDGRTLQTTVRPNYLTDAVLSGRAGPNPFHQQEDYDLQFM